MNPSQVHPWIFPTQGSNPSLSQFRWILYHLSHHGSPRILEWVAYPFSRGTPWPRNQIRVFSIAGRFFTCWATREAYSFIYIHTHPGVSVVKNPHANAGNRRDVGSVPGLGRAPGGGHGNPLQYSCLENPMGKGALWAIVHRVAKSQIQLKWLSTHTCLTFQDGAPSFMLVSLESSPR